MTNTLDYRHQPAFREAYGVLETETGILGLGRLPLSLDITRRFRTSVL
jgi:hypothetical protein